LLGVLRSFGCCCGSVVDDDDDVSSCWRTERRSTRADWIGSGVRRPRWRRERYAVVKAGVAMFREGLEMALLLRAPRENGQV